MFVCVCVYACARAHTYTHTQYFATMLLSNVLCSRNTIIYGHIFIHRSNTFIAADHHLPAEVGSISPTPLERSNSAHPPAPLPPPSHHLKRRLLQGVTK